MDNPGLGRSFRECHGIEYVCCSSDNNNNIITNLASGIRIWRVVAAAPGCSKLIFRVWLDHVANVECGATPVPRILGANHLLPFEVVAVWRAIVVTSRWRNLVSLGVL